MHHRQGKLLIHNSYLIHLRTGRLCWLDLCQLDTSWSNTRRGNLTEFGLWASLYCIFLTDGCWGRAQPTIGRVTPGQLVLGVLRSRLSKSVSSALPWSLHQLFFQVPALSTYMGFLQRWNCDVVNKTNPFLPKLLFAIVFTTLTETLIKTIVFFFF